MTSLQLQIGSVEMLKNIFRTRTAVAFLYGFALAFIAFTAFIAISNPATPPIASSTTPRSHFSSLYSYFFSKQPSIDINSTDTTSHSLNSSKPSTNQTQSQAVANAVAEPPTPTTTSASKEKVDISVMQSNYTTSLLRKQQHHIDSITTTSGGHNESVTGIAQSDLPKKLPGKKLSVEEELAGCNLYEGSWVRDESYPLYKPGSCSLIDEQFNCILNGRPDSDFQKLRWKPHGCALPRLDVKHMLKILKGKRVAFVGDSLNRNMWESLVCILKLSVKDPKKVFVAHGRHSFRTAEASYSFIFKDYDLAVELFISPFLVREWKIHEKDGHKKETLRLDLMGESAAKYKGADILIFNTGHWWTHEKTSKGEDYYQEGNHVYNKLHVKEAYRKAIITWAKWVDSNVNPLKTTVFFRGYSESHFSGGRWNSGGQCHNETEPITNEKFLAKYPYKMRALETVLLDMKTPVRYLNITRITDYRKDGHPSIFRKQKYSKEESKSPLRYQDCSHWCLPGVPDTWNELLYAELLVKEYQRQKPQI